MENPHNSPHYSIITHNLKFILDFIITSNFVNLTLIIQAICSLILTYPEHPSALVRLASRLRFPISAGAAAREIERLAERFKLG